MWTLPKLFQLPECTPSKWLSPFEVTWARCHHGTKVSKIWHMVDWISIDLKGWLRVAIHSHILCLWCTDDKVKVSCCFCYFGQLGLCSIDEDSSKAMSSAKSRLFNYLAGCRLERRGWITTPESSCDVAFFSR